MAHVWLPISWGSKSSVTPVSEYLPFSSEVHKLMYTCHTYTYIHIQGHAHINAINPKNS